MKENWTKGPWFVRDLSPTKDGHPYFIVQAGGPDIGDGWVDVQKTFKQQKKEKEKVAEVKAIFQEKLRKRIETQEKERSKAFKAPRYDEVFFAGVNTLEELAGEKLDQCNLVCEFSESFWKSKARHDPDLS